MGADKVDRIPVKVIPTETPLRKPDWIRVRMSASPEVAHIKSILRKNKLASVCEEAACPNLAECFSHWWLYSNPAGFRGRCKPA